VLGGLTETVYRQVNNSGFVYHKSSSFAALTILFIKGVEKEYQVITGL